MTQHATKGISTRPIAACLCSLLIAGSTALAQVERAGEIRVSEPVCATACPLYDLFGNLVPSSVVDGGVASPIGSTYSVQHLLGGDLQGTGQITCYSIEASPAPGAPDNIVTFDAFPEPIKTHVNGVVPVVSESLQDFGGGSEILRISTSSAAGGDLFPGGQVAPNGVTPLTAACFFIGLQDPLTWDGLDTVTAGNISFYAGNSLVAGPFDLMDPPRFTDPWNGLLIVSFQNLAGQGVTRVELEITVAKSVTGPIGACCLDAICVGDTERETCAFQGGIWNIGASCGADPTRPHPVCQQDECAYDNGVPLFDHGAVHSQFAPDEPYGVAAADEFMLRDSGSNPCRIQGIRTWVTHPEAAPGSINPATAYAGLNVTIYASNETPSPRGRPFNDGSHAPDVLGGIVMARQIPMNSVTVTAQSVTCLPDRWQLDIPVDVVLSKNTRYWLEIQPILDDAIGRSAIMLSQSQNEYPARRIATAFGVLDWQDIVGNANACPAGNPPSPAAGTRRNLAFQLLGGKATTAVNNDCADAIILYDGITPFSTRNSTTDGPNEPEMCEYSEYTHIESDVWYEYTATCSGTAVVSLCGSDYDTKMAVYPGCGRCPVSELPIACNEDFCSTRSQVEFPAEAGECYTVRIGGFLGAQGAGIISVGCNVPPPPTGACCILDACIGTFSESECAIRGGQWFVNQACPGFTCPVDPPQNDLCEDAIELTTGVEFIGTNIGAGGANESSCGFNDNKDVWHYWTADCTGDAVISLCTPAAGLTDTTLAVFSACDGVELGCNDDACQITKSLLAPEVFNGRVPVNEGMTYFIRVAGWGNSSGQYRITVLPCAGACCDDFGCSVRSARSCAIRPGGVTYGPGTVCLGDGNGNQIDDLCESCPTAEIVSANPPDGVIDARQPSPPNSGLKRQGIGSFGEPIVVSLDAPIRGLEGCFSMCETQPDPSFGANSIFQVSDLGGTDYEIILQRPITPGAVTTIQYTGGTGFVSFTSHPANVNGDSAASPPDILDLIDCCLNGVCAPAWGLYSCDVDHSGVAGPPDILRVIDLLNGAGDFVPWLNTPRPVNTSCP